MSCEITRLLKLCDGGVQPVSVVIPRRDKNKFHEELFPPAPGIQTKPGPLPSITGFSLVVPLWVSVLLVYGRYFANCTFPPHAVYARTAEGECVPGQLREVASRCRECWMRETEIARG